MSCRRSHLQVRRLLEAALTRAAAAESELAQRPGDRAAAAAEGTAAAAAGPDTPLLRELADVRERLKVADQHADASAGRLRALEEQDERRVALVEVRLARQPAPAAAHQLRFIC